MTSDPTFDDLVAAGVTALAMGVDAEHVVRQVLAPALAALDRARAERDEARALIARHLDPGAQEANRWK